MTRLRIAVVGAGHLGRIHARLLAANSDVELVAIVEPLADSRLALASEVGATPLAHHAELAGRCEAAVIATPTQFHHQVACDLLHGGLHLFIEKPITACSRDADQLVSLADDTGRVLQVGHVERFNPAFRAVADRVGAARMITAARTSGHAFRSLDIGVVLDLMIHDIDLVLALVGRPVREVRAVGRPVLGPEEDVAEAWIEFHGGCVASLRASRVSPTPRRSLEIVSDEFQACLDLASGQARLARLAPRWTAGLDVARLAVGERVELAKNFLGQVLCCEELMPPKRNAIQDQHADFLTSIRTGTRPMVCGRQARDAVFLAERILAAIHAPTPATVFRPHIAA